MMEQSCVELKNIYLTYHTKHDETTAVENLSMSVAPREFVSIVGPSGCGKTTVLSMLAGTLKPSSGKVTLDGIEVTKPDDKTGYMLQSDQLLSWRTIEENIYLGLEVKHMKNEQTKAYALSLLEKYGLKEFKNHYPSELSGGMRQKVALIRTLAFSPEVLLLDEPFSALDYQTRLTLADEIHRIIRSENKTAILVTHDISEAISMSDKVFVFSKRPARVKSVHEIKLSCEDIPLSRRNAPEFSQYFESIWKEIETNEN